MRFAYKYRLYPNKAQVQFLENQLHEACDLYNAALQERRGAWKAFRKSINYYDQANQLKPMRAEGLLGLANFSCCQDVLRRLDKTFQAFFARVRRGENPASRASARSGGTTALPFRPTAMAADCSMTASCVSRALVSSRSSCTDPWRVRCKTVTIKRDVNHWYVCFSVERDSVPLPESFEDVGVDVGLDAFAALSNGDEIDNPRHLKCGLAHLVRAQRRLSRRKRTSRRHHKAATLVSKAHRKIRNQRAAFHHELSRWLVEHYGLIAVEDLNIKRLSRGMLAGPVHDAGWNSFFAKLSYKAASAGRELVKVDPRGTSQICICGAAIPKTLAERWHECPVCGLSAPRNVVSAQVILQRARIGRSRHNVEDFVSCVPREAVASQATE